MITGFNTDIDFDGVTYHVQTEDKGLASPMIMSLVYQNGTILASKRSPYEDLIEDSFDEDVLAERLKRQHKLICAAIKAGRIEDLKRMTMKNSSRTQDGLLVKKESRKATKKKVVPKKKRLEKSKPIKTTVPKATKGKSPEIKDELQLPIVPPEHTKAPPVETDEEVLWDVPISEPREEPVWDIPVIEEVEILTEEDFFEEEEIILSSDAVEVVGDLIEIEEVIGDELRIGFLQDYDFKSGDKKDISVLVFRGESDRSVADARVMIKILGADFRPMIFHSKTNQNGIATVLVKLPNFRSGRAAVLVRANIDGEEAELRKVISQK